MSVPPGGLLIAPVDSIRRLAEHVLALPIDAMDSLTLQDVALCQVWLSNAGPDRAPLDGIEGLQPRIERWLADVEGHLVETEGRRGQTLLRELIDRLERDQADKMTRDELDLLETVHGFSFAIRDADLFERVRRAIAPRRERMQARRASLPPAIGAPALSARLLVVRPADIAAAIPREVKRFAGVDLASRGPVLVHSGHVRVLGDVPEGTSVVVEEGACVVDGCVLGRIAVSGDCEVMENVSGVIVSRNGDVRARHLVDGAFVVAKRGSVRCRRCHGARLVFAGATLAVADRTKRSHLFSPVVSVGNCLDGGTVHTSQSIVSGSFVSPADAPLNLVFRRGLSCQDYGEDPGRPMSLEVGRALRARAELSFTRQQLSLTVQEAEDAAETALTYILASDAAGQLAGDVLAAQRRLDVLNRVLIGLRALYAETEASLDAASAISGEAAGSEALLERLDNEICQIVVDGAGDTALQGPYDALKESRAQVRGPRGGKLQLHTTLTQIGEKLQRWRSEFLSLTVTVRNGRENIRKSVQAVELFEEAGSGRSRVLTFQRLKQRVPQNGPNDKLRKRLESPFVAMMTRTIDARMAQARKLKDDEAKLQQNFQAIRESIWNQYQMRIDDGDSDAHRIVIEGRFETTANLWADPAYMELAPGVVPAGGKIVAAPSGNSPARYVCTGNVIAQEQISPPAVDDLVEAI